jgi:hypothetical protein
MNKKVGSRLTGLKGAKNSFEKIDNYHIKQAALQPK